MEADFRARVWEDEERESLERQAKARAMEAKNLYLDEAAARLDLQKWLALEQMVQSDGWTALVSWLGAAYDQSVSDCVTEEHQAAIRVAQGSAQALSHILTLPALIPSQIERAKAALTDTDERKLDVERSRSPHPA